MDIIKVMLRIEHCLQNGFCTLTSNVISFQRMCSVKSKERLVPLNILHP